MDSIGIIVAKLIDGLSDLVMFFGGTSFPDKPLEPGAQLVIVTKCRMRESIILKSTLFTFIVELVSQQALNCGVHDDVSID